MSVPLAGYTTTRLVRASARSSVYEARRKSDGQRVLAKVFEVEDEGAEARVEHEFRLLQQLDLDGVVRALGVERAGRQVVLLLEYVPGRNLAQQAGGEAVPLARFLAQAREMAATLARIHERRIIHRDIKPSNVLVEQGTGKIVFADFGISVLLEDEQRRLHDPEVLQGTLPYVSPEQTGRTRREVDFRSDLYSLGVTFYELLTGRRPFESKVPLELIHAHLAQRPRPPRERVPTIPALLSAIVMKLLEKPPEHRYQSACGLAADLDRLASALAAGEAEPSFPLAEHDHPSHLQLPHQLYGRECERAALERELRAVIDERSRRLVLLAGAPGSGKSALLRDFDALLGARRGYLGVGKFEQPPAGSGEEPSAGELPYRGFAEALSGVVRQILSESDEQLASWRTRLRASLGPIAGVVGALVPELPLVVGEMSPVPELELGEARNRLHLALARFVATIAETGPLVLALDDLQWADPGNLDLLGALMLDPSAPALFVGAYRNDQPAAVERLRSLADALEAAGAPLSRVNLAALSGAAVEELLVDVLGRERERVAPLAEIIGRKTGNNPLFVRQYLIQLAELGLLRPDEGGWAWELEAVAGAAIPDDLLGVMRAKLERLPAREREVLQLAACVGAGFDVALVEALFADELGPGQPEQVVAALYELERAGLIVGRGSSYRFSHDRIRDSARVGLAPAKRRRIHAAVGRELLARHPLGDRGDAVFAIADQLSQAAPRLEALAPAEREQLATLNLEAGLRALSSAAWRSSLRYLEQASRAFGPARGDGPAFEAEFGLAQARALAGQTELADAAFEILLEWELPLVDYARVVARRIRILLIQDRLREALDFGRAGLERCGVRVPTRPSMAQMILAVVSAWRVVKGADLDSLLALPEADDERAIAAMLIVTAMKAAAFSVDRQLYVFLTALHARLVMTAGYHPSAVEGLAQLVFAALAFDVGEALRLCDDLVELAQRRESSVSARMAARSVLLLFVGPAGRSFRGFASEVEAAFTEAMEAGDRLGAGYLGAIGLWLHVEAGTHLREVAELEARMRRELPRFGSHETLVIADTVGAFVATISAEADARPPGFSTLDELGEVELSAVSRYALIIAEVWGRLLFGEHERARALMDEIVDDYEKVLFGSWVVPRAAMFDAILVGERARASEGGERRRLLRRLRKRLATARKWAGNSGENFRPCADLIAGEIAWVRGDARAAVDAFERARSLAAEHGRADLEVLACLRLAALGEERGWAATREGSLRAAHTALSRWGAWAVVRRLELGHPELALGGERSFVAGRSLEVFDTRSSMGSSSTGSTSSSGSKRGAASSSRGSGSSLDLASVLRTMQALSEDLRLEQVIPRVLGSAMENVGADHGVLLLERAGSVAVVAEGRDGATTAYLDEGQALREAGDRLPTSIVNLVLRTGESVVVDDVREDARFAHDDYFARVGGGSLLCVPIVKQGERVGALVLENRLTSGAFTEDRLETLRILLGHAASALENARLYAQLERSEAQWRSLVDGVPDIIALLDERGRIEFINHVGQGSSSPGDFIGQRGDATLDPESAAGWRAAFAEVVETGEAREVEVRGGQAGARRWYATRLSPIHIAGRSSGPGDGRAHRYLAVATDVTARKGLEAQLRQQQRLESVGTLASGVAHEINNPVQGILNYAELLGERAEDPETVREFAGEITHESERVATIVRNLLAFSRQEVEQRFEDAEVGELIEDTLSLVRAVLRKDQISLHVDVPAGLPRVHCRVQQIQQIIMNLVTNARDALNERYEHFHEHKRVDIRARAWTSEGRPWVRISVEDRAGGIPEAIRARIFDPFFTTKRRDRGTGLGLAVSHGIAADHGGELSLESELGVGTTFHLDLPASDDRC